MKNSFPISIWLMEGKEYLLHCIICGNSLGLKMEANPKQILLGTDAHLGIGERKPLTSPVQLNCQTRSQKYGPCPARYIIQGYIYPEKDED